MDCAGNRERIGTAELRICEKRADAGGDAVPGREDYATGLVDWPEAQKEASTRCFAGGHSVT
jgi:hypothetical protein